MNTSIIYVAKVVGILTTIVIVTLLFTSDVVKNMYWEQISKTTNETWGTYTLNNGVDRYEAYTNFLNSSQGDTFEAVGE